MYQSRLRIDPRGAALDEPGMLIGGMVGHEVEDQLEPVRMRGRSRRIEIRQRPEQRIDIAYSREMS